jgi:small subunit ribosomal protein S6
VREYEFVYVIQPDATPEREAEIHQRIDQVVSDQKGRLLLRDDWGKRRLSYEIKKFQKGHYFQVNFLGGGKEIAEIERLMRLDSDILRYLSVLADEEVTDVETRVVEAAKQAAEQAQRRAEREAERAAREEREKERERGLSVGDDDDDEGRFRADDEDEE